MSAVRPIATEFCIAEGFRNVPQADIRPDPTIAAHEAAT
jgi:hypothetical protein